MINKICRFDRSFHARYFRLRVCVRNYGEVPNTRYAEIVDIDGRIQKIHYLDTGTHTACSEVPLVILSGTAQTINSWGPHLRPLARTRRLILPELRCQGIHTTLDASTSSISQHISDLEQFLNSMQLDKVDLAGFSFGGRVGIAMAAAHSHRINKLSVTGVPYRRPIIGELIMRSWVESLQANEFRATAWSFLLNGYSTTFLRKHHLRMPQYLDVIMKNNDPSRLVTLIGHNFRLEIDPYTVDKCVSMIRCPTQIIAGTEDRISGHNSERELADCIPGAVFCSLEGAGHLVPFESPQIWRNLLLDFLNADQAVNGMLAQAS